MTASSGDAAADEALAGGATGFDWRRVHPVTPLVRGWVVVVVVVLGFGRQVLEQGAEERDAAVNHLGWVGLGLLALAVVVVGLSWLSWRFTAFALTDDAVHVRRGVIWRQHRKARLDRVQAIDVEQPFVARLVGLAELKIEVAGGSGSAVTIAYLREADARLLRAEVLARAAGVDATVVAAPRVDGAAAPVGPVPVRSDGPAPSDAPAAVVPGLLRVPALEAPEQEVYEVPSGRLVGSTLLTGEAIALLVVLLGVVGLGVATHSLAAAFTMIWVVVGLGSAVFNRFNRGFAFRAATSPDGIRLEHGLTESRAQTIPPGRVQAVELHQPLLWRRNDWWVVRVNVAGYGNSAESKPSSTVLHPVATRHEAFTAVWLVLPDLGTPDPVGVLSEGLGGTGPSDVYTAAPRRARWLDPVAWRRTAFTVTHRALVARTGRLHRRLVLVPHGRTQSLGLRQGPVGRRLGIATFVVHSTPGPVSPQIPHLDGSVARRLLDEQVVRAREARAHDVPERWMRPETAP
ncbi:PH domain-containing protein [Luteimicrobium subarcticum]|uniref:Putative membrane protein n=1 Tax=Luteimicrobium subarcticum TaxID=620910 RepID=A0A2M8WSZ1_9MICO|nr:PH domain-containing protein [Luteimicrobium subarcticum]PJI93946.1 putative membrane protein [Luteimicrobium subarcticum]